MVAATPSSESLPSATTGRPSPTAPDRLVGVRALVTGSSRGVGAATARDLAASGARVVVNYRSKAQRAEKVVAEIEQTGGEAIAVGADITDPESVSELVSAIERAYGGLDLLVLNASGGMETNRGEDYALRLNRDAQLDVLRQARRIMPRGARVVFVTSHQAHFIRTAPTLPDYEPVARSKRAGEDALLAIADDLVADGIELVVVSGDMIEGTITATLLERRHPGAIAERKRSAGRLYDVEAFAAEVVRAVVEPVPEDRVRLVGDVSDFLG